MSDVDPALNIPAERERFASLYVALMRQIMMRLEGVQESLLEVRENPDHPNNWKNAEFCYLQIRKICEYLALAVLTAHHSYEEAGGSKFEETWHAADLFKGLIKVNPHSFPVPIKVLIDQAGPGEHHVEPDQIVMGPSDIASIYGQCGGRLHVGDLKTLISGKLPPYDLQKIAEWRNNFVRMLNSHMILLPHIGSALLVTLKDQNDGEIHCAWAVAEPGPFTVDDDLTIYSVDRIL